MADCLQPTVLLPREAGTYTQCKKAKEDVQEVEINKKTIVARETTELLLSGSVCV
jgi:hypothetical protein